MRRLKVILAYDGTDFVGWQRQARGASVQGLLEGALGQIDGQPVRVDGAGRTDAGVHALAQVASCSVATALSPDTLRRALNACLPTTVRVLQVDEVDGQFHARFSARRKTYRYLLFTGPVVSPFIGRYVWHVPVPVAVASMEAAARALLGQHDFSAFQSTGTVVSHAVRTVTQVSVQDVTGMPPPHLPGLAAADGRLIAIELTADGFLRHMVRAIVGTLVEIGTNRRAPDAIGALIAGRSRAHAGATAPACGLWLVQVEY